MTLTPPTVHVLVAPTMIEMMDSEPGQATWWLSMLPRRL